MRNRATPLGLRIAAIAGLLFLHLPLALIFALRLHHRGEELPVPAARLHDEMVRRRLVTAPRHLAAALSVARGRRDRHGARAGLRHARRRRAVARQVLRPRDDLAAVRPADRAARHHHRHRAALGLRHHGHRLLDLDHRARPRHVLHRRRLQQCRRALPPAVRQSDRSLDGSRRRRLPDLPPRHPAANRHRAARRRHARLRAVLRRGDRHHLHRRPAVDACRSGCWPS